MSGNISTPIKTIERRNVERILNDAKEPMSCPQIAALAGIKLRLAQAIVGNMVQVGAAHNVNAGTSPTRYMRGSGFVAAIRTAEPLTRGSYDGAELRPFSARQGAMDAFALPSLANGQRIQRKAPCIMSITQLERTLL